MNRLLIVLISGIFLMGCSKQADVGESSTSTGTIEAGYLSVLSELTSMMESHGDPAVVLDKVRTYVTANRDRVSEEINKLNKSFLDMPEESRGEYRRVSSSRVEASLEAYAKAQIGLKQRMNDAQKWELSEVLSQLKP